VRLYRVFPFDQSAASDHPGGALFVPPSSGLSRIDNPDLYDVLYVAHDAPAAVAESFARYDVWRPATFVDGSGLPYALATYELPDDVPIFDLNDVDALKSIGVMRPTDVVTRDRAITQAWARTIFLGGAYAGARWWSYYNPDWPVAGLWDRTRIQLAKAPEVLSSTSAVVRDAATTIVRQITR
jgi:hypothetical protein